MAGSLNRCSFIGNLGRDPEIKTTQDGSKRYSTEIVLQGFGGQLIMLDPPQRGSASTSPPARSQSARSSAPQQPRSNGARAPREELDDETP